MNDQARLITAGIVTLILFMIFAGQVMADDVTQPAVTDTVQQHQIFMQNMLFAIATWFAFIVGAVCGFAAARKRNSGGAV